jgi:predicted DNA-binding transcriptional regulator AlpA
MVAAGIFCIQRKEARTMESQTVDDFCTAHGISRGLFYNMSRRGEGPRTFKIGRCRRISQAAALEWIAAQEAAAGEAVAA